LALYTQAVEVVELTADQELILEEQAALLLAEQAAQVGVMEHQHLQQIEVQEAAAQIMAAEREQEVTEVQAL
jgi:hypothetical protein